MQENIDQTYPSITIPGTPTTPNIPGLIFNFEGNNPATAINSDINQQNPIKPDIEIAPLGAACAGDSNDKYLTPDDLQTLTWWLAKFYEEITYGQEEQNPRLECDVTDINNSGFPDGRLTLEDAIKMMENMYRMEPFAQTTLQENGEKATVYLHYVDNEDGSDSSTISVFPSEGNNIHSGAMLLEAVVGENGSISISRTDLPNSTNWNFTKMAIYRHDEEVNGETNTVYYIALTFLFDPTYTSTTEFNDLIQINSDEGRGFFWNMNPEATVITSINPQTNTTSTYTYKVSNDNLDTQHQVAKVYAPIVISGIPIAERATK